MIENWTAENKSKLNSKKSNIMIFNFTDLQFTTRLYMENTLLNIVDEVKLLGTVVTSDLKWQKNTNMLTSKAFKRMIILQKLNSFQVNIPDMLTIYKLYIRSIVEQNCQVWHYSLTEEEVTSIERVQKVACKLILKQQYGHYRDALEELNLETLAARREKLCLTFAKRTLKHPKVASMFPLNHQSQYSTRKHEKYLVQPAKTDRLKNSSIPQLQRALNADALTRKS